MVTKGLTIGAQDGRKGRGWDRVEIVGGLARTLDKLPPRLCRVTTKHRTKEYHPRTFWRILRARSRELYYPRGQSGTLRGHCTKRGTVFQGCQMVYLFCVFASRRAEKRESTLETPLYICERTRENIRSLLD